MRRELPAGILAVIRAADAETAIGIAIGLDRAGVAGIEITFTVPDAGEVIRHLATTVSSAIGAGTVRTLEDCATALDAGATFIVSPDFSAAVVQMSQAANAAAVPGALTPGEIGRCIDAGADAVKLFPVNSVGGVTYLRTLAEPFPGVRWVVSGGIGVDDVQPYLEAGAHTVCMGGALIDREAAAARDSDAIAEYASRVLQRAGATGRNR